MFTLKFNYEDDQFYDETGENYDEESIKVYTIRILEKIVSDIENGAEYGPIMSINGNKLGTWEMQYE